MLKVLLILLLSYATIAPATLVPPSSSLVYTILQQDKKECRVIDAWPQAPEYMFMVAVVNDIDPCLLPAISRVEGPTPTMLAAHNLYGLEVKGKLLEFSSFEEGTECAARLLAKHKWIYQVSDIVSINKLAEIWCPANKTVWADNMIKIYTHALNHNKTTVKRGESSEK